MPDYLTAHSQSQPNKLAVIDDRPDGSIRTLNWKQLNEESNRLAHVLIETGHTQPGNKVLWCGQNSIGVVVMIGAARKLGVTAVPLNYRLSDDESAYVTDHCDATVVFVDADNAATFERIRSQVPKVKTILVYGGKALDGMLGADELMAAASTDEPVISDDRAPGATMIYTSGTTGKPKGALRTSPASAEQGIALVGLLGSQTSDVYLTTGPIYHSGPGGFMATGLAMGQTVVVQRKFDPLDWLRLVDKYKVTSTFSAPTPIRMVCNLPAEVKAKYDVTSMKRMVANAAPWSMTLKHMYLESFPHDSLYEIYGSTELGVNCVLLPEDQLRKPGSCGKAVRNVETRVVNDDMQDVAVGEVGEIVHRSPHLMLGYFHDDERTKASFEGDWFHSGDLGVIDDEGYITVVDRKKDMIKSGGENVASREVEEMIYRLPQVSEVAVIGLPDAKWVEAVTAVVVVKAGQTLDEAAVIAHCAQHMAGFKTPKRVVFTDTLPKNPSGKLLKRDLRQRYA